MAFLGERARDQRRAAVPRLRRSGCVPRPPQRRPATASRRVKNRTWMSWPSAGGEASRLRNGRVSNGAQHRLRWQRGPGIDLGAGRVAQREAQPRHIDRRRHRAHDHALDHQHRDAVMDLVADLQIGEGQARAGSPAARSHYRTMRAAAHAARRPCASRAAPRAESDQRNDRERQRNPQPARRRCGPRRGPGGRRRFRCPAGRCRFERRGPVRRRRRRRRHQRRGVSTGIGMSASATGRLGRRAGRRHRSAAIGGQIVSDGSAGAVAARSDRRAGSARAVPRPGSARNAATRLSDAAAGGRGIGRRRRRARRSGSARNAPNARSRRSRRRRSGRTSCSSDRQSASGWSDGSRLGDSRRSGFGRDRSSRPLTDRKP